MMKHRAPDSTRLKLLFFETRSQDVELTTWGSFRRANAEDRDALRRVYSDVVLSGKPVILGGGTAPMVLVSRIEENPF